MKKTFKNGNELIIFILSLIVTIIAAFRPLSLGYDTPLYLEVLDSYWSNGTDKFPDLIFSSYTFVFTSLFESGEASVRLYLSIISIIQGYLFFRIIKNKPLIEALTMVMGYGPLIFFDIIRQGLSMLLVGYYLAVKRKNIFLLLALMTHINGIIIFLKIIFFRNSKKYIILFSVILGFLLFISWGGLEARFNYYIVNESYLAKNISEIDILNLISINNILVIIFLIYSGIIGKFSKYNSILIIIFYLLSIAYPLFFRIYFFYFFIISCSEKYIKFNKSINDNLFNILYIIIITNFAFKTKFY